jgi:hypothetical protein
MNIDRMFEGFQQGRFQFELSPWLIGAVIAGMIFIVILVIRFVVGSSDVREDIASTGVVLGLVAVLIVCCVPMYAWHSGTVNDATLGETLRQHYPSLQSFDCGEGFDDSVRVSDLTGKHMSENGEEYALVQVVGILMRGGAPMDATIFADQGAHQCQATVNGQNTLLTFYVTPHTITVYTTGRTELEHS